MCKDKIEKFAKTVNNGCMMCSVGLMDAWKGAMT